MGFGGESAGGDLDALDRVLADAREVRVREMPGDSVPLLIERDPVAVGALRAALLIADRPGFICMCQGDVALDFFTGDGGPLTTVTLHHGYSIRWKGWPEDALLADGVRPLEWLAVRGVSIPLQEYRAAEQRRVESDRTAQRWAAEIPAALAPNTALFLETSRTGRDLTRARTLELHKLLVAAHPDPIDRILRLCTWFGAGTGAYTGYPMHEDIPLRFLDLESHPDFADAVEIADDRATAGAVRYLLSFDTRQHLSRLLTALSPAARRKILVHARDPESRRWLQRRIAGLR